MWTSMLRWCVMTAHPVQLLQLALGFVLFVELARDVVQHGAAAAPGVVVVLRHLIGLLLIRLGVVRVVLLHGVAGVVWRTEDGKVKESVSFSFYVNQTTVKQKNSYSNKKIITYMRRERKTKCGS